MAGISTTPALVIEFNDDRAMVGRDPYLEDLEDINVVNGLAEMQLRVLWKEIMRRYERI